jgi:signal transduction histidine kinase
VRLRLIAATTGLVVLVVGALAFPLQMVVARDQHAALVAKLQVEALSTASIMGTQPANPPNYAAWTATAIAESKSSGARVIVVDGRTKRLIVDSQGSELGRVFVRPEITHALNGDLASGVRPSETIGGPLRYTAAPVVKVNEVVAAVRLTLPEKDVNAIISRTRAALILFAVVMIFISAMIAWAIAEWISNPLRRLALVAKDLPEDLSLRAHTDEGPGEVRSVALALNETAERLGTLLGRMQRVAADASHHLRTPLTGVRLRLEAIEDVSDQNEVQHDAKAALVEVDKLSRRIDQVLALAQSDAADTDDARVTDISNHVTTRVESWAHVAAERGIVLESLIVPGLRAKSRPGAVERIVDELIGNAMLYARGSIAVTLKTFGRGPRAQVILEVGDDGPGVPEEEREILFQRFQRGSHAKPGGSGLGLALVSESARADGGLALLGTSVRGGLLVTVAWPAAEVTGGVDPSG